MLETRLPWVQGARSLASPPIAWQELLYRRLTGLLATLETGDRTTRSEEALDLGTMVYYFVGRSVPRFGHHMICFRGHQDGLAEVPAVTPFDTGALNKGWLMTAPPLGSSGRARFVDENTHPVLGYEPLMDEWLSRAYSSTSNYIDGVRPTTPAVPEVLLDESPGDSSIWTWEGRLALKDYPVPPVQPMRVFVKNGHLERYLDWLDEEGILLGSDYSRHVTLVYDLVVETEKPLLDLLEYVKRAVH